MLRASVLGKLYSCWLCSAIFNILRGIYRPFSRAFRHSAAVRFLARAPRIEIYYKNSLTGRAIEAVWRWLLGIFGNLMAALKAPARGSVLVRWGSGSHFCSLEFLMCAFVFAMFCAPHSLWSNSYALLGAAGLFGLYFLMSAAGAREGVSPLELGFPFLLFVIACLLSLGFTSDLADSVRVLLFFAAAFLMTYVFMADLTDIGRMERLMKWMYFAVLATSLYAVAQRFMGVEVSASYTDLELNVGVPGRVYSTLDNPNNYAEFLVLFTPPSVAWAMQRRNHTARLFACGALALPMLALIMTYCRGGWLSIAVSALVFVYYLDKRLIPVGLVACILLVPFLPDSIMTRISTIFNSHDSSANHRLVTWQGILHIIGDYGLTGIGMEPDAAGAIPWLEKAAEQLRVWAYSGMDKTFKRAQSMEKRIERMRTTDKPTKERRLDMKFGEREFRGDEVLTIKDLKKSFDGRTLFDHVNLEVVGGERIALIGDNGTGKSTLIKLIVGEEEPDAGWVRRGPSVRMAYLPQIIRFNDTSRSALDTMIYDCRCSPQEARDSLGAFGFSGEDALKEVGTLSGGEQSRLRLCMLMRSDVNLLILDEPTNHLDIASREWMEDALEDYGEALMFVSHDRYFIEKFATRIWAFEDGQVTDFRGGFQAFREYRERQEAIKQSARAAQPRPEKKPPRKKGTPEREKQLRRTEREIEKLEGLIRELDAEAEANGSDYQRLMEIDEERSGLSEQLDALYEEWEELSEEE